MTDSGRPSEKAAHGAPEHGIHVPTPTWRPIIVAVGLAMALAGMVLSWFVVIAGLVIAVVAIVGWVRDARKEFDALG